MPANNSEIEKRLWDTADECGANFKRIAKMHRNC